MGNKTIIWIIKKAILYGGLFAVFYVIGWGLNIVPQPLKDMVNWFANNLSLLAFCFCFTLGAYVAIKFLGNRRGKQ
jgi:hypothetical protein